MRNWLQHIEPLLSRSLRAGAKPLILKSVAGILMFTPPLLLTSCSEDHPDEPYSETNTRTAIPDSSQVDVSIAVDTSWQDTLDFDFNGNPINTNSDTTTITLPDMPEEGDANDAA